MQRDTDDRLLLHALSISVLASDETGVVNFANDAATELFRTTTDGLVGHRVGELVEASDATDRALLDVLDGTRWQGDLTIRLSGDETWSPPSRSRRSATRPAQSWGRSSRSRT